MTLGGERVPQLEEYREHLIGQGLSPRTVHIYVTLVAHADQWMHDQHHTTLAWAAPSHIADYATGHVTFSHSSRGQAAAAFRHYWDLTGRTSPPVKAIRVPPQPEMVCRAVDDIEARALTKTAIGWRPKGTAVLFGLYLALRRTEIATAEWSRFTDDLQWYTVTGKGAKTETLPVHPVLRDELAARNTNDTRWVFPGRFGGHVTPATIWTWSKEVAAAAGIDVFTTHQLRHTALTTANDNTGDLRAVQTFARHKNPDQTAGYTRTKQTKLREVSDALDYL
jgi:integrase/recombinase XerD